MKHLFRILPVVAALLLICITPVAAASGDEVALESPVIYGDFNNYVIEGADAKPLAETAAGSGIFKASYNFDAYTGTAEGYSVFVCVTKKDYDPYGWGAGEQYTLSGEAAAMGSVSIFKPIVSGLYEFTYDSNTHVTTVTLIQAETPAATDAQSPATADTGTMVYIISGVLSAAAVTLSVRKIRK